MRSSRCRICNLKTTAQPECVPNWQAHPCTLVRSYMRTNMMTTRHLGQRRARRTMRT